MTSIRPRCDLCNSLEKRNPDDVRLGFDFAPEELTHAAFTQRCDCCLVILEGLRQTEDATWSLSRDVRRLYVVCLEERNGCYDSLSVQVYFIDDRPKLELEFYSLQPHAWGPILPRPVVSRDQLPWMLARLDICENNHVACSTGKQSELPTRVISLHGLKHGNGQIRLWETNHEHGTYVALSHRWGSHQACTTTKATLQDRKHGIEWTEIPKTYQDAMQLALKLGVSYIWIDSLCIIQDDQQDWEVESSRMANVYQLATLTIAATSSTGDAHGCFSESLGSTQDVEITLPDEIGACRIAVRRRLKHWDNLGPRQLEEQYPLLSRGWAFQERLLSPRVLHLCASEMVWECREASTCQCGSLSQRDSPGARYHRTVENSRRDFMNVVSRGIFGEKSNELGLSEAALPVQDTYKTIALRLPNSMDYDPEGRKLEHFATLYADELGSEHFDDMRRLTAEPETCSELGVHFQRTVEQYTALRLTKRSDRLPALSGLCEPMKSFRGEFLVGLWSDSLCFDLLWRLDRLDIQGHDDTDVYDHDAPSWSWVSANKPVSYWYDLSTYSSNAVLRSMQRAKRRLPLIDNKQEIMVFIARPGKNPFGNVTTGTMFVRASAVFAALHYTHHFVGTETTKRLDARHYTLGVYCNHNRSPGSEMTIPFFADYPLGIPGPHFIADGSRVALLEVHSSVAIVLYTAQGTQDADNIAIPWRRIGIARISDAMVRIYKVDWMTNAIIRRFNIR